MDALDHKIKNFALETEIWLSVFRQKKTLKLSWPRTPLTKAEKQDSIICPAAEKCTGGKASACDDGTYQDSEGQHSCLTCIDGFLCDSDHENPTASPCPAGSYCEAGEQTECAKGTFNHLAGQTDVGDCTPCLGGFGCASKGLVRNRCF